MKTFGQLLREARTSIRPKLSAKKVAEQVGLSDTIIYEYEKDRKTPSVDTVTKLARIYGNMNIVNEYFKMKIGNESDFDNDSIKKLRNDIVHQKIDNLINRDPSAILAVIEFIENYSERKTKKNTKKKPADEE